MLERGLFEKYENDPIDKADADKIWVFIKDWMQEHATEVGAQPSDDPFSRLVCFVRRTGLYVPPAHDSYIGPHWIVRPTGFTKTGSMDKGVYVKDRSHEPTKEFISTYYCHLQPDSTGETPANGSVGSEVVLGDAIGAVGDWVDTTPKGRLSLGYGVLTSPVVDIYIIPAQFDITSQMPNVNYRVKTIAFDSNVAIPTTSGPHLHFEVGRWSEVNSKDMFQTEDHGQSNPVRWVNNYLGSFLQTGSVEPDWILKSVLQSESAD